VPYRKLKLKIRTTYTKQNITRAYFTLGATMNLIPIVILGLLLSIGPVFAGSLDLGLSSKSGVTDSQSVYLGLDTKIKEISLIGKLNYGEQNDIEVENKAFLRLGYDPKLTDKWSLWFYDQIGYNRIRNIDFENFIGGGPKYSFYKDFSISAGLLQHHKKFENDTLDINRLSFRLKGEIDSFKAVIFYQPNLEDFDDYIFAGEASFRQDITSKLSLKLTLTDQYRSMSIGEKNDLSLVLALGIEL